MASPRKAPRLKHGMTTDTRGAGVAPPGGPVTLVLTPAVYRRGSRVPHGRAYNTPVKALIAGWFSFENSDATAGDLLACDVVCEWLAHAGIPADVARASPFPGGVDLRRVDPAEYPIVVFVCGPFMPNAWEAGFLGRFAHAFVVGVNLSMPVPLEEWNPFDVLLERDSSRTSRPDLSLLAGNPLVPVVGVCLVEPYDEAVVPVANAAVERLLARREMAVVRIDTRLDINTTGLRTKAEVESLLARMDAVVTTRLHGTVLSLRNGVPALVIDPEIGGGRIRRQAEVMGWPIVFTPDMLDETRLEDALTWCLSGPAREQARRCAVGGASKLATMPSPMWTSSWPRNRAMAPRTTAS